MLLSTDLRMALVQGYFSSEVFILILICIVVVCKGQTLSTQTCSTDGTAVIQEDATAWITGIISLNEQGTGGYGCGSPGSGCKFI